MTNRPSSTFLLLTVILASSLAASSAQVFIFLFVGLRLLQIIAIVLIRSRLTIFFLSVGRLSHEVGWQYRDVVAKLEEKRKVKGAAYFEQKKKEQKLVVQVGFP